MAIGGYTAFTPRGWPPREEGPGAPGAGPVLGLNPAPAPAPAPDSPEALKARYGNMPETYQQLAIINGWNQGQTAPVQPSLPATISGPTSPAAPGPTNPAAPSGPGSPGGGPSTLADLRAQIMGYNPADQINKAYELTKAQGLQALGMDVEDQLAARGVNVGSATGQDLRSRLTAQLLGPLQAQHAQALAQAQGDRLSRLQSLTGMEMDQQRLQQEADYRRSRDAADDAYRSSQQAMQQRQAEQAARDAEASASWRQQQEAWSREDRASQQQQSAQDGQVQQALRSGLMGGPTSTPTGSPGLRDIADIWRNANGGVEQPAVGGPGMGGGAGLSGASPGSSFGQPTPGWNDGAGRSGTGSRPAFDPSTYAPAGNPYPRGFQGPQTSTVAGAGPSNGGATASITRAGGNIWGSARR